MREPLTNEESESIHDEAGEAEAQATHAHLPAQDTVLLPPSPETTEATFADSDASSSILDGSTGCPRCGAEFTDRLQMGWCQRCGYCRSFECAAPTLVVEPHLSWPRRVLLFFQVLPRYLFARDERIFTEKEQADVSAKERVPEWLGVLLCGIVICALGSVTAGLNVRQNPPARLIWCVGEAILGVMAMAAAHIGVFMQAVPHGQRRQQLRVLVSPKLWLTAWRQLPETRWPVWLLIWGITLSAGAAYVHLVYDN